MQTAGGERGLRHIACQTAQTGLHAMCPGIAPGDESDRTDVQQQPLPAGALREEGDADACGHCPGRYPSLCAGTFGAQAVFAVASFAEVVQVVDKVCRYLHHSGKEQA